MSDLEPCAAYIFWRCLCTGACAPRIPFLQTSMFPSLCWYIVPHSVLTTLAYDATFVVAIYQANQYIEEAITVSSTETYKMVCCMRAASSTCPTLALELGSLYPNTNKGSPIVEHG